MSSPSRCSDTVSPTKTSPPPLDADCALGSDIVRPSANSTRAWSWPQATETGLASVQAQVTGVPGAVAAEGDGADVCAVGAVALGVGSGGARERARWGKGVAGGVERGGG